MTKNKSAEKRKEDILHSAVDLFLEKGYEGTSMEAIAKKSSLTKGGLYHHFNSKEEILLEANNLFTIPILEMLQQLQVSKNPLKGLETYITSYLKHWDLHSNEVAFTFLSMVKMLQQEELKPLLADYGNMITGLLEKKYNQCIEEGIMHDHDTKSTALCLASSLDGILAYMLTDSKMTHQKVIKLIKTQFIETHLIHGESNV